MSDEPIVVTAGEGGDRSRAKKLLVVAAVVFVATLAWPRLTGGGGAVDVEDFPVVAAPAPAPAPAPATGDPRLIGTSRDPFRALVSAAPAGGAAAPAPAPAPAPVEGVAAPLPVLPPFPVPVESASPTPVPTTVPPTPTPTTVAAPKASPTTTIDPRTLRKFSLLSVSSSAGKTVARVAIDDATMQVGEGETFFVDYEVVSLDADAMCGVFEYRGKAFALCHGESTRT